MGLMMNKHAIKRGSIWFVDLDPVEGHEQGKKRPCLIVSDDLFNASASGLVAVVPITKRQRPMVWFIPIDASEGGLKMQSYIISNQVRVISVARLIGSPLGTVSSLTMIKVERSLRLLLGL